MRNFNARGHPYKQEDFSRSTRANDQSQLTWPILKQLAIQLAKNLKELAEELVSQEQAGQIQRCWPEIQTSWSARRDRVGSPRIRPVRAADWQQPPALTRRSRVQLRGGRFFAGRENADRGGRGFARVGGV
jgi:hypothetical protein